MTTYRLLIEYEGTRYSGWQTQSNTSKTVQGSLIRAAREVFQDADVGGAGRTDAGVHASGQVAHLRIRQRPNPREVQRQLNDLLPHDIHVIEAAEADHRFHARHDATSRIYLYQISRRRTAFGKPFVWWIKDSLDVGNMSRAAQAIEGMHDFTNFSDKRLDAESTKVLVDRLEIGESDDLILIRIGASHFLWKMVRKLIAAIAEVGRGSMHVDQFLELIDGPRNLFQPTAPPSGLFLEAVTYEGEVFDRPLEPLVPVRTYSPARQSERWGKRKKR